MGAMTKWAVFAGDKKLWETTATRILPIGSNMVGFWHAQHYVAVWCLAPGHRVEQVGDPGEGEKCGGG